MAKPPESTKTSLRQRLDARAEERWPQLAGITVRWRGSSPTSPASCPTAPTFRCSPPLRHSASTWGFAIYRASHDDYEKSVLPSGSACTAGSPRLRCGLYLGDHTAWLTHPPDH